MADEKLRYSDAELQEFKKLIQDKASLNMKRTQFYNTKNWLSDQGQSPYFIMDFQEIKTTWHPIENIGGTKGGY